MTQSCPITSATLAGHARHPSAGRLLDRLVFWHLAILVVGLSWSFGGQIPWARTALHLWGTAGIALFVYCASLHGTCRNPAVRELWPFLLFDIVALVSCFNPSFKTIVRSGESYFALITPPHTWLPSSARPDLTWRELWQLNGILLSVYNLRLTMRSRRTIRGFLYVIAINATALAVFGTLQKLVGAKGLWFGLVKSPQIHFFSTFVYHNHWSAFTILNAGACLGLLFHHLRRGGERDLWHSPVPVLALAILLLVITTPLSASRSGSVLMGLLVLGGLVHYTFRLVQQRRARHESIVLPIATLVLATMLAAGAIIYLGRHVISQRLALTTEQLAHIHMDNQLNARLGLYRDTWHMALEKPWFGWGLETYGDVFRIYNSAPTPLHGWKTYYLEAHNDWLQSLAESGFVGTGLLLLCGFLVLRSAAWRPSNSLVVNYLFAVCGIILLYAWVEFPFANPSVVVAFCVSFFAAARYAELDPESGGASISSQNG